MDALVDVNHEYLLYSNGLKDGGHVKIGADAFDHTLHFVCWICSENACHTPPGLHLIHACSLARPHALDQLLAK